MEAYVAIHITSLTGLKPTFRQSGLPLPQRKIWDVAAIHISLLQEKTEVRRGAIELWITEGNGASCGEAPGPRTLNHG